MRLTALPIAFMAAADTTPSGVPPIPKSTSTPASGQLDEPVDVAVHPKDGRVYVLDKGGYVAVFGRMGKPLARWLSGYRDPADNDEGMLRRGHRSMGIDLSPDGKSVYVSNSGSCMVSQFDTEGELIRRWGEERSSEPGLLRWNRGMAPQFLV